MQFNVSASLTDSPVFSGLEKFFKGFKDAGVNGIELAIGFKTRFNIASIKKLSDYYDLPITSIHQSAWSAAGIRLDERFIRSTRNLNTSIFVFHPLPFTKRDSKRMHRYYSRLTVLQKKYGITICLENMPNAKAYKRLFVDGEKDSTHLNDIYQIAQMYDLKINYDTSHGRLIMPGNEKIFQQMFPLIRNIHLSSFHKRHDHLPLSMGDFDSSAFISYLYKKNYTGLISLEVYYPRAVSFRAYDFSAIKDSVSIVKSISGK